MLIDNSRVHSGAIKRTTA